ncbi:MAG TPA: hypothetical protein VMU92_10070 [Acidobacteriaceae bacterium]|nr:hypothetical protein [Acidobacteriaceae bacterium]
MVTIFARPFPIRFFERRANFVRFITFHNLPMPVTHLTTMDTPCKHPKVRVVAREEDVEFVECQECGEVFDFNELRDMAIEEKPDEEEEG